MFNQFDQYGVVDANAAISTTLGQSNLFPDVAALGGNSWELDVVNAPEVWTQGYTGQGVVVAVVDSGVDYTHTDLDSNIWLNADEIAGNNVDDDGNGYVDDVRGWDFVQNDSDPIDESSHGTHLAGIIAAENDSVGTTGVAYNAEIMSVRVLDETGSGSYSDVAAGVYYAANNGADVINLSLGGGVAADLATAIEYATEQGSLVVMAAGNDGSSQLTFPAILSTEYGVSVGAIDQDGVIADFSNRSGILPADYLLAPGVDVLSTLPNNSYGTFSGTSEATAYVSGVAALVLSANSTLTASTLEALLTGTADPIGTIA